METLLVEDDPGIRDVLTQILEEREHTVTACADAEAAWAAFQEREFRLILLDWMLPGMSGLELCRQVRTAPHGARSHILMLTARVGAADMQTALAAGVNDYLAKPFDLGVLQVRLSIAERSIQIHAALQASEERYRTLIEQLPSVTYIAAYGDVGIPLYISPQIEALVGYTAAEWAAVPDFWITRLHPEDRERVLAADAHFTTTWEPQHLECRYLARDGRTVWVQEYAALIRDAAQQPLYILGTMTDITARREAEEALRASGAHFQALIESAPIGAYIVDEQDIFQTVNAAFCTLFGYPREELVGQSIRLLCPQHERPASATPMLEHRRAQAQSEGELEMVAKGGRPLTVLTTTIAITSREGQPHKASFIVDITKRSQREQRLSQRAHFDSLTGLPNRLLFEELVEQALARARRHQQITALLFVDLDGFKGVNDTWGHAVGDGVLQAVARCLRRTIRESDSVARLAGDEFAVVLPDIGSGEHAAGVAGKIVGALAQGFDVEDHHLLPTASIGISLSPFAGQDVATLLKRADRAMYAAKRQGKNTFAFVTEND